MTSKVTRNWIAAVLAGALLAVAPALAQTSRSGLPPVIASAGVTQAQWDAIRREVRLQAQRAGVSEAALLAAAESAGSNFAGSRSFNALSLQQTIFEELSRQANQIAELQRRLAALTGDADPGIAEIFARARAALDGGRLAEADRLLAQVAERDLATIQQADTEAARRRLRAGRTLESRGDIAYVQANYSAAAANYDRAAVTVPQSAIEERWRYLQRAGIARSAQGEHFAEPSQLHDAIRTFRAALPLARGLDNRALSNGEIAYAAVRLADLGDLSQLPAAREALAAAQLAFAVPALRRQRGLLQLTTARLAYTEYQQGDQSALTRSVRAYEQAVTTLEGTESAEAVARATINLAETYLAWGDAEHLSNPIDAAIAQVRRTMSAGGTDISEETAAYANMLLGVAFLHKMRLAGYDSIEVAFLSEQAAAAFTSAERIFSSAPGTLYEVALQNNIGQYFETSCLYEAHWHQRPLPYCQEALRRYEAARAALSEPSGMSRTLDENIRRIRSTITSLEQR